MLWDSSPENSNPGDNFYWADSDLNTKTLSNNHVKPPQNISFNAFTESVLTALNTKSLQHDTVPEQIRTSEWYNDFVFTQTQQSQNEQKGTSINMETPSKSKKSKKHKLDTELEDVQVKKKRKKLKMPDKESKIEKLPTKKKKKLKEIMAIMKDNGDKVLKKKKKKKNKDKAHKSVFRDAVPSSSIDSLEDPLTNQLFSQIRENLTNVDRANSFENLSCSESAKSTFSIDTAKLSQMKSYLDVMEPQKQKSPKSGISSMDIHNIVKASISVVFNDSVTANTTLTDSGLIKKSVDPVKSRVSLSLKKNTSSSPCNEEKGFNETENIAPKHNIQNNDGNNDNVNKKKKKQFKLKDSALCLLGDTNAEKLSKAESQKSVKSKENNTKKSERFKKDKMNKSKANNGLSLMNKSPKKQVLSVSELDTTSDSDEADNTSFKKNPTAKGQTSEPQKVNIASPKKTQEKSKKSKSISPSNSSSVPEITSPVKKMKRSVASPSKAIKTDTDVDSYVASTMSTLLETNIHINADVDLMDTFKSPVKSIRKKTHKNRKEKDIKVESSFEHKDVYREISEEDRELLRHLSVKIDFDVPDLHKIECVVMSFPLKETVDEINALGVEVKKGSYTPDESETIINNWKRFCLIHNLPEKPELFMNLHQRGPDGKLILKKEEGINFGRFLAHGLPNRLLHSVHLRFRNIYATLTRGRFTPEEDKIIVETVERMKDTKNVFVLLGKELNRDALSIEKHYIYLRKKTRREFRTERISHEDGAVIVQNLMEEMRVDDVSMLKGMHIPMAVYSKIGDELQWRPPKLQFYWMTNIHPKLFVTGERELWQVKLKLIDMILANPEFKTLYHVNWQYFLKDEYFDGWTTSALNKMIKNMFQTQVDPNKTRKLFKETLAEFRVDVADRQGGYLKFAKFDKGVLYVE